MFGLYYYCCLQSWDTWQCVADPEWLCWNLQGPYVVSWSFLTFSICTWDNSKGEYITRSLAITDHTCSWVYYSTDDTAWALTATSSHESEQASAYQAVQPQIWSKVNFYTSCSSTIIRNFVFLLLFVQDVLLYHMPHAQDNSLTQRHLQHSFESIPIYHVTAW